MTKSGLIERYPVNEGEKTQGSPSGKKVAPQLTNFATAVALSALAIVASPQKSPAYAEGTKIVAAKGTVATDANITERIKAPISLSAEEQEEIKKELEKQVEKGTVKKIQFRIILKALRGNTINSTHANLLSQHASKSVMNIPALSSVMQENFQAQYNLAQQKQKTRNAKDLNKKAGQLLKQAEKLGQVTDTAKKMINN